MNSSILLIHLQKIISLREFEFSNKKNFLLFAGLIPVLIYPNIYWSLMGMEVAILSPLVSLIFCIFTYGEESNFREFGYRQKFNIIILFSVFFVGQITRPDFLLYNFALIFSIFVCRKNLNNLSKNLKF